MNGSFLSTMTAHCLLCAPMDEQGRTFLRNAAQITVARLESIHRSHYVNPITGLPNRQRFETDILDGLKQHDGFAILIEPLSATGMGSLAKSLGSEFSPISCWRPKSWLGIPK